MLLNCCGSLVVALAEMGCNPTFLRGLLAQHKAEADLASTLDQKVANAEGQEFKVVFSVSGRGLEAQPLVLTLVVGG